jgi:hypothetical protein
MYGLPVAMVTGWLRSGDPQKPGLALVNVGTLRFAHPTIQTTVCGREHR